MKTGTNPGTSPNIYSPFGDPLERGNVYIYVVHVVLVALGRRTEPCELEYIYISPTLWIGFGEAEYKYLALTKGIIIWQFTVFWCGHKSGF